jgi:hypothetical protein
MEIEYRHIYCYFRMGLVTGILERKSVIAWADRMILEAPVLTEEIMDLSLSSKLPYSQMIRNLNFYQGAAPDFDLSLKLLLAHAGILLGNDSGRTVELLRGLRLLLAEEHLPLEVRRNLAELDGALGLFSQNQVAGEVLTARLSSFLEQYKEYQGAVRSIIG